MAARGLVLVLGAVTLLVAAKAHGRQLRLERQLFGYWHVSFGGQNPAFVEALWRHERLYFWSLAATFALGTIGFRLLAPRFNCSLPVGRGSLLLMHVVAPLTVAFIATGLMSLVRLARALQSGAAGAQPEAWLSRAAWGSAGWWLLTIALGAALSVLAWRSS